MDLRTQIHLLFLPATTMPSGPSVPPMVITAPQLRVSARDISQVLVLLGVCLRVFNPKSATLWTPIWRHDVPVGRSRLRTQACFPRFGIVMSKGISSYFIKFCFFGVECFFSWIYYWTKTNAGNLFSINRAGNRWALLLMCLLTLSHYSRPVECLMDI